jgi:hypothetical protein
MIVDAPWRRGSGVAANLLTRDGSAAIAANIAEQPELLR